MRTNEVEQITGVTFRRLDYWVLKGWVRPHGKGGSGYAREWTEEDLERVIVIRDAFDTAAAVLAAVGITSGNPAHLLRKGSNGCCHIRSDAPPQQQQS